MKEPLFYLEEIPFESLKKLGISSEMVQDMPEAVLEDLLAGYNTPLIAVKAETNYGNVTASARFRLVRDEDGTARLRVTLKQRAADIKEFTEEQREALKRGKTVLANVTTRKQNADGTVEDTKELCFVQLDPMTNTLITTPSEQLCKTIKSISTVLNLDNEAVKTLIEGEQIQMTVDPEAKESTIQMKVDLQSPTGLSYKDRQQTIGYGFEEENRQRRYTFGTDGCWVNDKGVLGYVEEKDFTEDIKSAQRASGIINRPQYEEQRQEAEDYEEDIEEEKRNKDVRHMTPKVR